MHTCMLIAVRIVCWLSAHSGAIRDTETYVYATFMMHTQVCMECHHGGKMHLPIPDNSTRICSICECS